MKGERLIEIGGSLLFVAFIIFLLPVVIRVGPVDTSVLMVCAFPVLVILGFILVGVGWWVKKNETESD
ncbi:MAG: hypothetical protein KAU99_04315 [Thermoplasmata archaeon]|nr:hypothetical protein [Thermoplasmata archaeon]MCK4455553.1 hypothetical protein [Thermoplasmata archaeon]